MSEMTSNHAVPAPVTGPRLLYFADPMCSWCWGFSPVAATLAARYAASAPLKLVLGGLRPGPGAPLDDAAKATIRSHWEHVAAATGQPFNYAFFDRERFVYDTEPACRAVVAARRLRPGASPLEYLARVQAAFYRDDRDVTASDVLAALAVEAGFDRAAFLADFADGARAETLQDFELARQLGVGGFPTVIASDGERVDLIAVGYRPPDVVTGAVDDWLEG